MVVTAMTSMYAAAMPVAASAIAPTLPPGRAYNHQAAATSAPANNAPAPTRISGRRMPAWAASTSSSTTPIRVTATPATASTLPIQPSERSGRDLGGAGIVIGGGTGGGVGRGTYAYCWGQYGAGGGAYGITGGTDGAGR